LPGLVLLLIPADSLLSSLVQLRTFDSFNTLDRRPRHRPWWWVPTLWLDPGRAAAGTWLLKAGLGLQVTYWSVMPKSGYVVLAVVLGAGVVSQLYTRRERGVMLAPLGYLVGATAILVPWLVLAVGVIGAVTLLFAFRSFGMFCFGGAVGVGFGGLVAGAEPMWIGPALALFCLPLLAGLVTGKDLELPTRDASDSYGQFK